MINASHDKEFVFHDGSRAKNLLELVLRIEYLSDHDFHQFVNPHKNDFANWVEHVLLDKHFADKLRTLISRNETIHLIKDKISETTFGNSIIKIPKVEHDESPREEHVHAEIIEHHAVEHHVEHPVEHVAESHVEHKVDSRKKHNGIRGIFSRHESKKLPNEEREKSDIDYNREEHHREELKELKARHNFFQLFSKKELSKQRMEKIVREEEDKLYPETTLKDEIDQDSRENALWVILYFALVLLIITLLVYKLFL